MCETSDTRPIVCCRRVRRGETEFDRLLACLVQVLTCLLSSCKVVGMCMIILHRYRDTPMFLMWLMANTNNSNTIALVVQSWRVLS